MRASLGQGVLFLVCAAIMACGEKSQAPPLVSTGAGSARPATNAAIPGLYDPAVSCATPVAIAPRAAGAPTDDIRGLRLGTPLDAAVLYLKCLDKGGAVFASRTSVNGVRAGYFGRQVRTFFDLATGTINPKLRQAPRDPLGVFRRPNERYGLVAFGDPSHETVYSIRHHQEFDAGHAPTVASVVGELQAKYGEPLLNVTDSSHQTHLAWLRDPQGQVDSRRMATCQTARSGTWLSECGLTVWADIYSQGSNELLVEQFDVVVVDQSKLVDTISRLEAAWKASDDQRKQAQAQNAGANKPNL